MKKLTVIFVLLALALGAGLMAQTPAPAGAGAAKGAGGGQRAMAPQVPAATGPMLDVANKISDAVNKQDAAALTKMLADGAVYLDEDGHAPAISRWVTQLTTGTPAKTFVVSATHGGTWDTAGWLSFNYALTENYKDMPKTIKGTASLVLKKAASGDWQIVMVHGALEQKVAGMTQ